MVDGQGQRGMKLTSRQLSPPLAAATVGPPSPCNMVVADKSAPKASGTSGSTLDDAAKRAAPVPPLVLAPKVPVPKAAPRTAIVPGRAAAVRHAQGPSCYGLSAKAAPTSKAVVRPLQAVPKAPGPAQDLGAKAGSGADADPKPRSRNMVGPAVPCGELASPLHVATEGKPIGVSGSGGSFFGSGSKVTWTWTAPPAVPAPACVQSSSSRWGGRQAISDGTAAISPAITSEDSTGAGGVIAAHFPVLPSGGSTSAQQEKTLRDLAVQAAAVTGATQDSRPGMVATSLWDPVATPMAAPTSAGSGPPNLLSSKMPTAASAPKAPAAPSPTRQLPASSFTSMADDMDLLPEDDEPVLGFEINSSCRNQGEPNWFDQAPDMNDQEGTLVNELTSMADSLRSGAEGSSSSHEPSILQVRHDVGAGPMVGFLGQGPFWTCGSTPHCRDTRRRRPDSATAASAATCALFRSSPAGAAVAAAAPFDLDKRIKSVLGNCIDLLASTLDASDDISPPEEELTTVLLETKEQRLQWRDFLSEAVSKCRAVSLFTSFDVEAEPPWYARPPPSAAPEGPGPCVIAPRGAGWSPILGRPITSVGKSPTGRYTAGIGEASGIGWGSFGSAPSMPPAGRHVEIIEEGDDASGAPSSGEHAPPLASRAAGIADMVLTGSSESSLSRRAQCSWKSRRQQSCDGQDSRPVPAG